MPSQSLPPIPSPARCSTRNRSSRPSRNSHVSAALHAAEIPWSKGGRAHEETIGRINPGRWLPKVTNHLVSRVSRACHACHACHVSGAPLSWHKWWQHKWHFHDFNDHLHNHQKAVHKVFMPCDWISRSLLTHKLQHVRRSCLGSMLWLETPGHGGPWRPWRPW